MKSTILSKKKIKKNKSLNTDDIARRISTLEKLRQLCFSKSFQCCSDNIKDTLRSCARYSYTILIEQINATFIVINCRIISVLLRASQFERLILMNLTR